MNFGVKITILYVSFVALIITLVALCFGQKVELVSTDYYAQELKFQDKINATNNATNLKKSIDYLISPQHITLTIDTALVSKDFEGTVTLFRPSDSSKDVKLKMKFANYIQTIDTYKLAHGAYKLQLTWQSNHTNYFKEHIISIN